jgi:hypothetical protein
MRRRRHGVVCGVLLAAGRGVIVIVNHNVRRTRIGYPKSPSILFSGMRRRKKEGRNLE